MRAWVLMKQLDIAFEEVPVRFDSFASGSNFKKIITTISSAGKVPVLQDGDVTVWDSLAIAEYLQERYSKLRIWPEDAAMRSCARSICAEMHSGFGALRSLCPQNLEAFLPATGRELWSKHPDLQTDVARIFQIWTGLLAQHGGPLLFGRFCVADAFFAPVVCRIKTYDLPRPQVIQSYMNEVLSLSSVSSWIEDACREHVFLAFEEPYRSER